jgi:hypothetical protein
MDDVFNLPASWALATEAMTTNQGFKSLVPSEWVFDEFV